MPVRIQELPEAKHIFSHIEWHMTGYEVTVDELEKTNEKGFSVHSSGADKKRIFDTVGI